MLLRLVVICVAVVLLYLLVRRHFARPLPQKKAAPEIGRMVRCAQCGLHLPQEEALADGADFFCSGEHRDAARR